MNCSILSHKSFRDQVHAFECRHDTYGIEQNSSPRLRQVQRTQPFPSENQKDTNHQNNNKQLPLETDHQYLQRNHQQNRVQVIEYSKHLRLLVNPLLFQPGSGEHREKNSCGRRSRKPADQQIILPRQSRIQKKDIITGYQEPRYGSRRHGNKIIRRVRTPFYLIQLEFPPYINHDKSKTNKHQPFAY